MKVLLISTTSHDDKSTSKFILDTIEKVLSIEKGKHYIDHINAAHLHIVNNLSCYASGGRQCASKEAGKYRCWAHKLSHEKPEEYHGKDEMSIIYDALAWCDMVIFATSVRWGSHSAILQKIIERMNTLENRASVYGETNPLSNKTCGVVVTGHNAKAQDVASHLLEIFSWIGLKTHTLNRFVWQKSDSLWSEVGEESDLPDIEKYIKTQDGKDQINRFLERLIPK